MADSTKVKRARALRTFNMITPGDPEPSSVRMQTISFDGRHYVTPTIFPPDSGNSSDPNDWTIYPKGKKAFDHAVSKKEVFDFGADSLGADKFARGSWKPPPSPPKVKKQKKKIKHIKETPIMSPWKGVSLPYLLGNLAAIVSNKKNSKTLSKKDATVSEKLKGFPLSVASGYGGGLLLEGLAVKGRKGVNKLIRKANRKRGYNDPDPLTPYQEKNKLVRKSQLI